MTDINRLKDENKKLQLAVNELSILNDIASSISTTQDVEVIIDKVVMKCIKHLNAEEGTISLLDEEEDEQKFMTMIRKQDLTIERVPLQVDQQLTGWMLRKLEPLLSNDILNDERFTVSKDVGASIKSILSVPLMVKGKLIGYLAVFNKKDGQNFEVHDRRLLVIIASQSAQIIENARLYEEEKDYLLLKEEMKVATRIQNNLLPNENPEIDNYEITAINIPAKEVGGDYFDFISLDENNLGFCIGDITGKGMPAALLMANLQASLRSQALINSETDFCVKNINKLLHRNTDESKFATLFYGVLDPINHQIKYCNAGHDHPLLIRDGAIKHSLKATGMLLGVIEDVEYESASIMMEPNDILFMYSDGITEAMNDAEEEMGIEKMSEVLIQNADNSAMEMQNAVLQEVKKYAAGHPQSDDITIMVIKRVA